MSVPLRVLYCNCTYANVVPRAVKEEVLRRLTESGLPFDAVPDLCALSAAKDPCLKELAAGDGPARIAACYPRAVKWLFSAAGVTLPAEGVEVLNMRTDTADQVVAGLFAGPAPTFRPGGFRVSVTVAATAGVFRVALYEGAGSRPFDPAVRTAAAAGLLQKGYAVTVVRPGGTVSGSAAGNLVVVGRFTDPRPARADGEGGVTVFFRDADGWDADTIVAAADQVRDEVGLPQPGKWKPWFPVIDYDRCTNCMQCLSFCLFDVYGVSADKKIQVQNQNKCKTDCPACSRVCPEVAILFPKYRHGPINGDTVSADDVRRESMKVDISALLGGDIYQALRDRSAKAKSRFSKERDSDKALEERKKCLTKLGQQLDVPAEVFASLPSIDEIREKAAAAQAKAEAALAELSAPG